MKKKEIFTWILIGSPRVSANEYFSASEHGRFFFLHKSIQALNSKRTYSIVDSTYKWKGSLWISEMLYGLEL
jgi:hypothetical protein